MTWIIKCPSQTDYVTQIPCDVFELNIVSKWPNLLKLLGKASRFDLVSPNKFKQIQIQVVKLQIVNNSGQSQIGLRQKSFLLKRFIKKKNDRGGDVGVCGLAGLIEYSNGSSRIDFGFYGWPMQLKG